MKNYIPKSIGFADGFMGPRGDVGYSMILDFDKAKEIINIHLRNGRKILNADAGLDGDWTWNSQTIFDGKDFIPYTLHPDSIWAKPIMIINFEDGPSETFEIWKR